MLKHVSWIAALVCAAGAWGDESCGTKVKWEGSIGAAAAKAKADGKLVLVLDVSGKFDDPALT